MVPVFFLASVLASMVEPSIWQRAVRVETLRPGAETRGGASVVPAGFWRSPSLCALQDSLMHIAARHLDIDQGATARTQNTDGTGLTRLIPQAAQALFLAQHGQHVEDRRRRGAPGERGAQRLRHRAELESGALGISTHHR